MNKKQNGEIMIYKTKDWWAKIDVRLENETIWLNQKQMADLFDVNLKTVNEHLVNIYKSWELDKNPTIWKNQIVQIEWKREVKREVNFYNLDAIISVWYRVNSKNATNFRIWATSVLKSHLV